MIQRIQSVFLAMVALLMLATFLFPVWSKTGMFEATDQSLALTNTVLNYNNGSETSEEFAYPLSILAIVAAVLALYSLFSYKNRLKQVFLNMLNILAISSYIGFAIYFIFEWTNTFEIKNQGEFGVSFYLAFASILFILIANRFIRKDHKVVQSVDRLR